jgi:ParB-like nuclease domain
MQEVTIKCEPGPLLDIDVLTEFQGELKSLSKENYEKLKKEILETGFAYPIYVWLNEGNYYVIGGHQRKRVLSQMRKEGYVIPNIPTTLVHASTWQEAKRRVLQDVSQYGRVEKQGLYELITHAEIDVDDLLGRYAIPIKELDVDTFKFEYFEQPQALEQVNQGSEVDEWVGMPDFEAGKDYIKLILHFKTDIERERYTRQNNITVVKKQNKAWIVHL